MNVSSSKVSDLLKCSYSFYLKNVIRLPEKPHPKTVQGSCVHDILKMVLKNKRHEMLTKILDNGFSFGHLPSLLRYTKAYGKRYKIDNFPIADIEKMTALAFKTIKPHISARPVSFWFSEQRFEFKVGRANCSGIIDFFQTRGSDSCIIDFKTKGQRFSKTELSNNIQAAIYQLWFHHTYKTLVPVHFVMLRFPPTARNPSYHIQTVKAPTLDQLDGLRYYIDSLHDTINNYGIEKAYSAFCEDTFFCDRVCQFKNGFKYNSLMNIADNSLVGNFLPNETPEPTVEQYVEGREYLGCPKFKR